jgi:aromatic ring-opening dioxygenase LigB subunit
MIAFACISPHPPILLPTVGTPADRRQVARTIESLESLGARMTKVAPDLVVISSPHQDWGFEVPLFFLAKNLGAKFDYFQTQEETAEDHYKLGKDMYFAELKNTKQKVALVASGDLSHRLKINGPYGSHPDGAKFDRALIEGLKNNDIGAILGLDDRFPEAGECGLRSICFVLGILDAARIKWNARIISYEGPFGVGYLVADLVG